MPTHRHLTPEHQQTLEHIFGHHAPGHIEWPDLLHLIEAVGSVAEEGHGRYKFIVNGAHYEFARPSHDRITNAEEIAELKAFLERARMTP
jgi:hypothetical protein